MKTVTLFVWLCWLSGTALADTNEQTIVWRGKPVAITMVPGVEKAIAFEEDVQWSIPKKWIGIVSGEASSGIVFLKTTDALSDVRFHFRGIDSNQYYILDISASAHGESTPVSIVTAQSLSQLRAAGEMVPVETTGIIELTRFAFQWLYSPERLLIQPDDVHPISLQSTVPLANVVIGHDVLATPIKQWRTDHGLYAIALELINQEPRRIDLDPRLIRADAQWLSLASITQTLNAAYTKGDSVMLVLLAESSWHKASQWLR